MRSRLRAQRVAAAARGLGSVEFVRIRRHQRERGRRGGRPLMRRVVITGIGLVSAFGCDVETAWQALCKGQSATVALDVIEGKRVDGLIGAPVSHFSPREYVDPKWLRLMAPAVAFGVVAAELA